MGGHNLLRTSIPILDKCAGVNKNIDIDGLINNWRTGVHLINYNKIIDILAYTCNNSRSCVIVLYLQQTTHVTQSNKINLSIIRSSKKGSSYKIHTCGPVHQLAKRANHRDCCLHLQQCSKNCVREVYLQQVTLTFLNWIGKASDNNLWQKGYVAKCVWYNW